MISKYFCSAPTLLFVLSLATTACLPAIDEQTLDGTLQQVIDDQRIVGYGVSVFNEKEVLFTKGYGVANLEDQSAYTPATRQIIASISKTMIGMALLKGQEMSLFTLEDPINQLLPFPITNPHFPQDEITLQHLATHTSSIGYSELISSDYAFSKSDLTLRDFVYNYLNEDGDWYKPANFLTEKPGEYFDYTNIGAAVAAYVVEHASGLSFKDFTLQHILRPLALSATWFDPSTNDSASAALYHIDSTGFSPIEKQKVGIYPVRDLVASSEDLTKVGQYILGHGVEKNTQSTTSAINSPLSPSSVQQMIGPALAKDVGGEAFSLDHGIFWIIDKNQLGVPAKVIGHSGGDDGIFTMMWLDPERNLGYVMIANTSQADENFGAYVAIWQSLYQYGKNF